MIYNPNIIAALQFPARAGAGERAKLLLLLLLLLSVMTWSVHLFGPGAGRV